MTTESKPTSENEATPLSTEQLPDEPKTPRSYWWHFILFGLALSIGLYPYLKKQFPTLEKVIQPSRYYQRLGHESFKNNYFQQAIDQYKRALFYKGVMSGLVGLEKSATEYQIARCYMQLRSYGRAIHYARRAQKTSPQWLPAYILVVDLYTQLNQEEKFAKFAKEVTQRFSHRWSVWVMLGNGYRRLRQEEKAIASYERAIKTIRSSLTSLNEDSPEHATLKQKSVHLQTQLRSWKAAREKLIRAAAFARQLPPPDRRVVVARKPLTSQPSPRSTTSRPTQPTSFPIFPMTRSSIPIPRFRTHLRSQRLLTPPVFPTKKRK